MTNPMYPSLIPRYVDESWFASDQPVDEIAKLNELEANHEVWIREAQYRSSEVHTPHMDHAVDEDGEIDEDEDVGNEDEDEEDEDEGELLDDEDEHDDGSNQSNPM